MDAAKPEKATKKPLRPLKAMAPNSTKVMADEELARRLHEELNGPEASSPVAAATRRNRKAPSFYSPAGPGNGAAHEGSGAEDEGSSPRERQAANGESLHVGDETTPALTPAQRPAGSERPGSSAGKRAGRKASLPEDTVADNQSQAGAKLKAKTLEPSSRPPVTRSCFAEEATQAATERPALGKGPKSLADAKSEDLATLKAAPSSRGDSTIGGFGSSMASSSHASDQDQDAQHTKTPRKRALPKVPRMPMCRHGQMWYRARKVEENNTKVLLEFPGITSLQPIWLPRDSPRIWAGSYKGKDWRHLGDGAWEPKPKEEVVVKRPTSAPRGRKRRLTVATSTSDEDIFDEETAKKHSKLESVPGSDSHPTSASAGKHAREPESQVAEAETRPAAEPKLESTNHAVLGTAESMVEPKQPKRRGRPPGKRTKKEGGPGAGATGTADAVSRAARKAARSKKDSSAKESSPEARVTKSPEGRAQTPASISEREKSEPSSRRRAASKRSRAAVSPEEPPKDVSLDWADRAPGRNSKRRLASAEPAAAGEKADDEAAAVLLSAFAETSVDPAEKADSPEIQEHGDSPQPADQSNAGQLKVPGSGLGALAQALADASASRQPPQKAAATESDASGAKPTDAFAPGSPRSLSRRRKRSGGIAAVPSALQTVEEASVGGSGSGSSIPGCSDGRLSIDTPCSSNEDFGGSRPGGWRSAFKQKHRQRLEEIEAEEEAAQSQELVSEEAFYEQARSAKEPKRSMRPVRAPRATIQEASDALTARDSKDVEGGSPPPARRGGRGRGRWANHIKRGNGRGVRLAPQSPGAPETPRTGKALGGRGRRGGRWGNRAARHEPEAEAADEAAVLSDLRISAFGSIVDALERRAEGLPFQGFPPVEVPLVQALHPCHSILEIPAEKFTEYSYEKYQPQEQSWLFKMQAPPVPIFK